MSVRRAAVVITGGPIDEQTLTALRLSERLLARGTRVTVFAHGDATSLSAGGGAMAEAIAALLRRGLHGATLDWVVDADAAVDKGVAGCQASGVVQGDHADLWSFVREADLVLSVGGGR